MRLLRIVDIGQQFFGTAIKPLDPCPETVAHAMSLQHRNGSVAEKIGFQLADTETHEQ